MIDDWSGYFLKAEKALKVSSDAMLLRDYDAGVTELVKAKAFLDMVIVAICRNGEK